MGRRGPSYALSSLTGQRPPAFGEASDRRHPSIWPGAIGASDRSGGHPRQVSWRLIHADSLGTAASEGIVSLPTRGEPVCSDPIRKVLAGRDGRRLSSFRPCRRGASFSYDGYLYLLTVPLSSGGVSLPGNRRLASAERGCIVLWRIDGATAQK